MSDLPQAIDILEEGPREGFQIEKSVIPTADKIALIDALSLTGLRHIQVASFVNPKLVPGWADAEEAGVGRVEILVLVHEDVAVPEALGGQEAAGGQAARGLPHVPAAGGAVRRLLLLHHQRADVQGNQRLQGAARRRMTATPGRRAGTGDRFRNSPAS